MPEAAVGKTRQDLGLACEEVWVLTLLTDQAALKSEPGFVFQEMN